jgi:Flp pilus assembly protein CpaB
VKRQTLTLVLIGVILFIAGSAIAFASVKGAGKHAASNSNNVPVTMSAVVAKGNISAGTTGQSMISNNLVAIELIPTRSFKPTDLTTLTVLPNEVLTQAVTKGQAINSAELSASTSAISIPTGMDAITVTMTGTNALAGYLQPGSRVDVYANITKLSTGDNSNLPVPCTELAMSSIQVLDVSSTVPSYAGHKTAEGRTIPGSETVLLAVTGQQAQTLQFLEQNESLSVVQPQQGATPPPLMQCVGTGQTTGAP